MTYFCSFPMKISIVKIGGAILEDNELLQNCLEQFMLISGPKILVHGGGRTASDFMTRMGIEPIFIDGRRVTDAQSLELVTMTYSGLNKQIVARLQALGTSAIGLCGADLNLIKATKRPSEPIDFGYVGDITSQSVANRVLLKMLDLGWTPVISPLSHDGKGQLLNTNADTIASVLAQALQEKADVRLLYVFEKLGLLKDVNDDDSLVPEINGDDFTQMKQEGSIHSGMIPKLKNAFDAKQKGVGFVAICNLDNLVSLEKKTEVL